MDLSKRYLLFVSTPVSGGGWDDLVGSFDTEDEAASRAFGRLKIIERLAPGARAEFGIVDNGPSALAGSVFTGNIHTIRAIALAGISRFLGSIEGTA